MKLPFKYSKWPIIIYFLASSFIIGISLNAFYLSGGLITVGRVLWSIGGVTISTLIGWVLAIKLTGTIFTQKIHYPADPYGLVPHQVYWLNGRNQATFVGTIDFTGRYLFHVHGYHKKNDLFDATDLSPSQIRDYISKQKETTSN